MGTLKELAATPQTLSSGQGSIANGSAQAASTVFNNTTALAFTCDFYLQCSFGASTGGAVSVVLYLVPALDGTNYGETNSPYFQPDHFAGTFVVPTNDTNASTLYLSVQQVPVGPYNYTAYLANYTGQTLSAGWSLVAYPVQNQY